MTADGVIRVLLVEDDEDDYVLTRDLLAEIEPDRYELGWARTYAEGSTAIATNEYDLHLIDYRLGERDGLELIREALADGCTAPLLLLTGQADAAIDRGAIHAGAADYLIKGQISAEMLERSIRYAIERTRTMEALRRSDRLASVGTLAAGVAHEINNPLASVIANLCFMLGELEQLAANVSVDRVDRGAVAASIGALRETALEAQEGADRVRKIVSDLKMVARQEPLRGGSSDVENVLESALSVVSNEILRTARLVRNCEPVPAVAANSAQLGQVLVNLLLNAVQALPPDRLDANVIEVATRKNEEGMAVVEIRDSGCGIPADALGRLFDPFFTTKMVGRGTGLGLSICEGIISSLGGRIEVESEPGQGSTFRILLPTIAVADA